MQRLFRAAMVLMLLGVFCLPAPAAQQKGQAFFDLGVFSFEAGEYDSAEKDFKKALEMDPDNPMFNHFLGKVYLETGRYQEAVVPLDRARSIDPGLPELAFDWALAYYKMEKYARAADLFADITTADPGHILSGYMAGRSYYQSGQYRKALPYLEAAAARSPSVKYRGTYYAAMCYFRLGRAEEAREKFVIVKTGAEAGPMVDNAAAWIKAIDSQRKEQKPYGLAARVNVKWTDNLMLLPSDYNNYIRLDETIHIDKKDTVYSGFVAGRYHFIVDQQLLAGISYAHYQSLHDDNDQFDLSAGIGDLFVRYRHGQYAFSLSYSPSYYWLDSASYLRRHKITPGFVWRVNQRLTTELTYRYSRDRNFLNERRDADNHDVSLGFGYTFDEMKLVGAAGYEANLAGESENEYGYDRMYLRLGVLVDLPWKIEAGQRVSYRHTKYKIVDPVSGIVPKNNRYGYKASLSRAITGWLKTGVEYEYLYNDANIGSNKYSSNAVSLFLTATL